MERRPFVTFILVGMNLAAFGAMVASGISPTDPDPESLLAVGANRGTVVVFGGEWWRAFTSLFIHVGVLHLAVNMYSLWRVGAFVERLLGGPMYAVVYLLAGLGGSFASVLWNPVTVSAGASGAIFGLFGFIVGFAVQARHLLPPDAARSLWDGILATVAINLFLAFSVPYLDNAAHLGGAAIGLLAGFVGTGAAIERQGRGVNLGSQAIVLAAVIGLAVLARVRTVNNPKAHSAETLQKAEAALKAGRLEEAETLSTEVIEKTNEPTARWFRAIARSELGDYDGGTADLDRLIVDLTGTTQSNDRLAAAYALRASGHQVLGRFEAAERDLSRAHRLRPDPSFVGMRGYSRLRIGDVDGGLDDARATLATRGAANPIALNNLAWAMLSAQQDLDVALALADASIAIKPSAAAKGTRCWIRVARGEPELGLPDCVAAVEGANELMDRGMVEFIGQRYAEAVTLWERAAQRNAVDAQDLAPWLARARAHLDAGEP